MVTTEGEMCRREASRLGGVTAKLSTLVDDDFRDEALARAEDQRAAKKAARQREYEALKAKAVRAGGSNARRGVLVFFVC